MVTPETCTVNKQIEVWVYKYAVLTHIHMTWS